MNFAIVDLVRNINNVMVKNKSYDLFFYVIIPMLGSGFMPSARIHEVIVKKINEQYNMDELLLRIGTVAPDCWRNTTLEHINKVTTHFLNPNDKIENNSDYLAFYLKYKDDMNNPFYFGYLIHLIVDTYWKNKIDVLYDFKENGVKKCRLIDGSIVDDVDYFSYYENKKIQKELAKKYNLTLFPIHVDEVKNFESHIEELDINGLFGEHGTLNYINTRLSDDGSNNNSVLYDFNDIEKHINETVNYVNEELNKLYSYDK